jgi:hypothetical protein
MPDNNNHNLNFYDSNRDCIICLETIKSIEADTWVQCVRCYIGLHECCWKKYQTITLKNGGYCLCPHCQRVGSLGCMYKS